MIIGEYIFFIISFFVGLKNRPSIDHLLNTLRISRKYLTKLFIFLNLETTLLTCTYKRIQNKGNIMCHIMYD